MNFSERRKFEKQFDKILEEYARGSHLGSRFRADLFRMRMIKWVRAMDSGKPFGEMYHVH